LRAALEKSSGDFISTNGFVWWQATIPVAWEAEIGRIIVPGQFQQGTFFFFFPIETHLSGKKLGMMVCGYQPSDVRKYKTGGLQSRLAWPKCETLAPKQL
jgi:hypothetical protein